MNTLVEIGRIYDFDFRHVLQADGFEEAVPLYEFNRLERWGNRLVLPLNLSFRAWDAAEGALGLCAKVLIVFLAIMTSPVWGLGILLKKWGEGENPLRSERLKWILKFKKTFELAKEQLQNRNLITAIIARKERLMPLRDNIVSGLADVASVALQGQGELGFGVSAELFSKFVIHFCADFNAMNDADFEEATSHLVDDALRMGNLKFSQEISDYIRCLYGSRLMASFLSEYAAARSLLASHRAVLKDS